MQSGDKQITPDISPRSSKERARSLKEVRSVSSGGTAVEHFAYITENYKYLTSEQQKNEYSKLSKDINKPSEAQNTSLAEKYVSGFLKHFGVGNTDTDIQKIAKEVKDRRDEAEGKVKFLNDSFAKRMEWLGINSERLPGAIKDEYHATVLSLPENMDTIRSCIDKAKNFDKMQEHIKHYVEEVDKIKQLQMKGLEALDSLWHDEIEHKRRKISKIHSKLSRGLEFFNDNRNLDYDGEYLPGVSFKEAIEKQHRNYNEVQKNIDAKEALLLCETTSVQEDNIKRKNELLTPVNKVIEELEELKTGASKLSKAVNDNFSLFFWSKK